MPGQEDLLSDESTLNWLRSDRLGIFLKIGKTRIILHDSSAPLNFRIE